MITLNLKKLLENYSFRDRMRMIVLDHCVLISASIDAEVIGNNFA